MEVWHVAKPTLAWSNFGLKLLAQIQPDDLCIHVSSCECTQTYNYLCLLSNVRSSMGCLLYISHSCHIVILRIFLSNTLFLTWECYWLATAQISWICMDLKDFFWQFIWIRLYLEEYSVWEYEKKTATWYAWSIEKKSIALLVCQSHWKNVCSLCLVCKVVQSKTFSPLLPFIVFGASNTEWCFHL